MAKTAPTRGRASIFRGKAGGKRVAGIITKHAGARFEQRRKSLALLAGRAPEHVSDADVIESWAVGEEETRLAINALK